MSTGTAATGTATEKLFEYAASRGPLRIDREKGIIHGVKILGLESKNGRSYPKETAARAIPLYEGARVNVNHDAKGGSSRNYEDRIGVIRNPVLGRADEGLYADFHFNPKHALAEQLLWDAEHSPENVGFSHVIEGRTERRAGKVVVEEIKQVLSVDLVADPATTRGLFESQNQSKEEVKNVTVTLESLRAEHPQLVEAIVKETLANQAKSEEAVKQAAELKTLKEEIDRYKAAEALAAQRTAIEKELTEAKLPEALVTETFRQTLLDTADAAKRKALIEDRQTLAKIVPASGTGKPVSREQTAGGGTGAAPITEAVVPDAKAFAARLRS